MMTNCYQCRYWQIRRLALYTSLLLSASVDQSCCRYIPVFTCPPDVVSFFDLLLSFSLFFFSYLSLCIIRETRGWYVENTKLGNNRRLIILGYYLQIGGRLRGRYDFIVWRFLSLCLWDREIEPIGLDLLEERFRGKEKSLQCHLSSVRFYTVRNMYFISLLWSLNLLLTIISYQDTRIVLADRSKTLRLANLLET